MVTKEQLANIEDLGHVESFPGWLCNRFVLIRVGEEMAKQYEKFPTKVDANILESIIASLSTHDGVEVKEDESLRLPYVDGDFVECEKCEGNGHMQVDCDCPNCDGEHECDACDGDGGTGNTRKDAGQMAFVGTGKPVLLQASYVQLLEGRVVRFDTDNERFLVFDQSGEGVAIIKVVRGEPVKR